MHEPPLGVSRDISRMVWAYRIPATGFDLKVGVLTTQNPTLSGTVYTDEGDTNIGSLKTIWVVSNGGTLVGTTNTDGSGNWTITGTLFDDDDVVVYLNDETEEATTVVKFEGSSLTDVDLYQNTVIVRGSLSVADMDAADDGDADVLYNVSAGDLAVNSSVELHVWQGANFNPNGGITTQSADMHVVGGTISSTTTTVEIDTDSTINGGLYGNTGTFTISYTGTPTVTLSATGTLGGGGSTSSTTLYNVTTSGSGTTTIADTVTVANDLTAGASATLNGTPTLTVSNDFTGTGAVSLTGGTTTLSATVGDFGSATSWAFNHFTVSGSVAAQSTSTITVNGSMSISGTLNAGSKTFTLTD